MVVRNGFRTGTAIAGGAGLAQSNKRPSRFKNLLQESFTMKLNFIKIPKLFSLLPLALLVASCGANFENIEEFGRTSAIIQD